MFAKYLSKLGNKVTVLRSGAFNSTPDQSYIRLENVDVISYLGDSCEAELFENNRVVKKEDSLTTSNTKSRLRKNRCIKKLYHYLTEPINSRKRIK